MPTWSGEITCPQCKKWIIPNRFCPYCGQKFGTGYYGEPVEEIHENEENNMKTGDALTEADKKDVDKGIGLAKETLESMKIGDMEGIDDTIKEMIKKCENDVQKYAALKSLMRFLDLM